MLCRISTILALFPAEILACVHHHVSNLLLPLTVFGRESCWKLCYPLELCTRYEILKFLVYIIHFERILQTRSKNCEKLGKGLFNYDLSSEARKNPFTCLKTPQNCFFSSHLFFRQPWTKVLGHFRISGAFPIHTGPTRPLTPQTMLDASITEFFFEFQLCIRWGVGEMFEKDAPF